MTQKKYDAIVFDCDGTLSAVEGIVELAKWNQVAHKVSELTEQAMGVSGMTPALYQQRLAMARPTRSQCVALAQAYYDQRTPGLDELLENCKHSNIAVFVVSAGVNPAVHLFAKRLGVDSSRVYAVDLRFDQDGRFVDFDRHSPMTMAGGKRQVVTKIKQKYPRVLYVGDGKNDLDVYDDVTQFVGYGGAYYRPMMASACSLYLTEASFLPIVPMLCEK